MDTRAWRRHPDDERGREQRESPDPPPRTAADSVLALQRSAGNHAVSAVLARAPDTAVEAKEDKTGAAEGSGPRATLPGVGTIAVLAVSFGRHGGPPERDDKGPKELFFTSRLGEHSAKLQQAAAQGTSMDVVDVLIPGSVKGMLAVKLGGVIVSSYGTGGTDGKDESWALSAESVETTFEEGF